MEIEAGEKEMERLRKRGKNPRIEGRNRAKVVGKGKKKG